MSRFEPRGDYPRGTGTAHRKLIRPPLNSTKEPYNGQASPAPANSTRKKPAPPDQTHAENFYFLKQMQARTPMTVVLTDGELLNGTVEWYDRDCIKLTRNGSPNLMVYKHSIKYLYKAGEEAASGGSNGSPDGNGNGSGPNGR
ncbi:MAG TPA: RNA chaperone Hfq [Candidatus Dormibacteraeota bacterium]|nr:RNA chaperone Hfq [Candidatus Dormibacteraeota bacterium]